LAISVNVREFGLAGNRSIKKGIASLLPLAVAAVAPLTVAPLAEPFAAVALLIVVGMTPLFAIPSIARGACAEKIPKASTDKG
jgi:hypothetical protein